MRLALIAFLCAGVALGCAQIRKVTYPPDYVYLERKQVRSNMALLGFYLRQVDDVLLDDSTASADQQSRIIGLLNKIDAVANELAAGVTTNHLVIDDHIGEFKSDVRSALINARANPPNYFALGRLSGSCIGCHKFRE